MSTHSLPRRRCGPRAVLATRTDAYLGGATPPAITRPGGRDGAPHPNLGDRVSDAATVARTTEQPAIPPGFDQGDARRMAPPMKGGTTGTLTDVR